MSIAPQKPQAVSHMMWFFVLPAVGFMVWASIKIVQVVSESKSEVTVFERLDRIEKAKSPGDRWQAAYALAQDLQKMIHEGNFHEKLNNEEREELYVELTQLLKAHASDERLKKYLLLTLGQMSDPMGLPPLEEGLKDPNPEIRFFSAWGFVDILLKHPDNWTPRYLETVKSWAEDSDPSMRKLLASTLVQLPEWKQHEGTLKQLLQDPEQEVRWNTAVALASKKSNLGKNQLLEMFDLAKLRSMEFKSTKDLASFVASAFDAAQKLNDPVVLASAEKLRAGVNGQTPEGKAILSALK